MHYFDFAATTAISKEALDLYNYVATNIPGNANSLHAKGDLANRWLQTSASKLAALLHVRPEQLVFTSGGTEANEVAIETALRAHPGKKILISGGEHASIHHFVHEWEMFGYTVETIPFTEEGVIDLSVLQKKLSKDVALVALQHVNHEIGTRQPIERVAQLLTGSSTKLHVDCVQSFGKMDLRAVTAIASSISLSSHKIHGPNGVGVTWLKEKRGLPYNFSSRTKDVPSIASFVGASEIAEKKRTHVANHLQLMRQTFIDQLLETELPVIIYGKEETAPTGIVGFGIQQIEGEWLMHELSREGFYISTGSACYVGMTDAAMTMQALGVEDERAREFCRVSFGESTTTEGIDALISSIEIIAKRLYT